MVEKRELFLKTASWWCLISPFTLVLTSVIKEVPIFNQKIPIAILGILSVLIGYISNFIYIPIIKMFDVTLTIIGATLAVISIGNPNDDKKL